MICPESIHRFVYDPDIRRQENLVPYLARVHRHRLPWGHRHTHRDLHIPERISIRQRPAAVENRKQVSHWENDSVMARASQAAVNVLVERTIRLTKLSRLSQRTAWATSVAIVRSLSHLPSRLRRTRIRSDANMVICTLLEPDVRVTLLPSMVYASRSPSERHCAWSEPVMMKHRTREPKILLKGMCVLRVVKGQEAFFFASREWCISSSMKRARSSSFRIFRM